MGLPASGLIHGRGAYMTVKFKAGETTGLIRQSENFYLKKINVSHYLSIYLLVKLCT